MTQKVKGLSLTELNWSYLTFVAYSAISRSESNKKLQFLNWSESKPCKSLLQVYVLDLLKIVLVLGS